MKLFKRTDGCLVDAFSSLNVSVRGFTAPCINLEWIDLSMAQATCVRPVAVYQHAPFTAGLRLSISASWRLGVSHSTLRLWRLLVVWVVFITGKPTPL